MKLFGTDGIRGKFNEPPIKHEQLIKIGLAFAESLFGNKSGKIYISNDGRESFSKIESALTIGIEQQGSKAISIGLLPTPAMSICLNKKVSTSNLYAGIQITASHNPYYDNGVKFFNNNGHKIGKEIQEMIENNYISQSDDISYSRGVITKKKITESFDKDYINYINDYFNLKMSDIKNPKRKFNILVDCSNGATSKIITNILKGSFVNLIPIHNEPTGKNINQNCGATNTEMLKKFILDFNNINISSSDYDKTRQSKKLKIDLGAALDGDGDRIIFISPCGVEINGDDILYILALFHEKYKFPIKSVVGTQMTNHGIQELYKKNNIKFIETNVGDKYVLDEMIKSNSGLGGESSGHILIPISDRFFIGDGIITLINLLEVLFKQEKNIDDLKKEIISIPSRLFNTNVIDKKKFLNDKINIEVFSNIKKMLGANGRMLLRPSGTEKIIRLLIEHKDVSQIEILSNYFYDNINKNTLS